MNTPQLWIITALAFVAVALLVSIFVNQVKLKRVVPEKPTIEVQSYMVLCDSSRWGTLLVFPTGERVFIHSNKPILFPPLPKVEK